MEYPITVACTGGSSVFQHVAVDTEYDSLYYGWDFPLRDNPWPATPFTHATGYAYDSPFPNASLHPMNQPAVLNHESGFIHIVNYTSGSFVTCIRVEAWKRGQLISEVYRDLQLTFLSNCPPISTDLKGVNQVPNYTLTTPDSVYTGLTFYSDTVCIGDTVSFNILASDYDLDTLGQPQVLKFFAYGAQLGAYDTTSGFGRSIPTCAVPDTISPISSAQMVDYDFKWVVPAAYVTDPNQQYTRVLFTFYTKDDYCPGTGGNTFEYEIYIRQYAKPFSIKCLDQTGGNSVVDWTSPSDTLDPFYGYEVYRQVLPGGPWQYVGTNTNFGDSSYTDPFGGTFAYAVRIQEIACDGPIFLTDTIRAINLSAINDCSGAIELAWNHPRSDFTGIFDVQTRCSGGQWTSVATTSGVSYFDTTGCFQPEYPIQYIDGTCSLNSGDVQVFLLNNLPTNPVDQNVSSGGQAVFTANAGSTANPQFSWERSSNGGSVWYNGNSLVNSSGWQTSTFTIDPVVANMDGLLVRCRVGDSTCAKIPTDAAFLNVLGIGLDEPEGTVVVIPNPTTGKVHFEGLEGPEIVGLISARGVVIGEWKVDQSHEEMDLSSFEAGTYILIFKSSGHKQRLVIVK